ncbi:MAG: outer membrane protein assembly factor BamE [Deltaproteobacteria bacterium]|nr:outer membrane protein assembly factor BamE [Deltaproteobacteria bacterium]
MPFTPLILGICLAGLLFLAGCATVGHDFDAGQIPTIKIGKSTESDIRLTFGSPWRIGIEDGQKTWTYGKYRYNLFAPAKTRDLVIRFDDRGVVASYTYNTTENGE